MKFIWEEGDVDSGRMVHTLAKIVDVRPYEPGHQSEHIFIIGYGYFGEEHERNYVLVTLADGMIVYRSKSAADMAAKLTEGNFAPFSGADKDEIISSIARIAYSHR